MRKKPIWDKTDVEFITHLRQIASTLNEKNRMLKDDLPNGSLSDLLFEAAERIKNREVK